LPEFIGQSIWFPGHLKGAQFVTDDGLAFAVNAPGEAGAVNGLSIRPNTFICRGGRNDVSRIPATVVNVEFFGAELIVSCRLDGGRVIRIPIRSDDEAVPGRGCPCRIGSRPTGQVVADD